MSKTEYRDVISIEEYKKRVYDCLMKYQNCSAQQAEKVMAEYETDFQEFYKEDYGPEAAAFGMVMHYL